MLFPRTKLISQFHEIFIKDETKYIAIVGENGIGKTTFLDLLQGSDLLKELHIQSVSIDTDNIIDIEIDTNSDIIILDFSNSIDFYELRTFIESKSYNGKVIFTSTEMITENDVTNFIIPGISFREYSEGLNQIVDIGSIMSGASDISSFNSLRDNYLHLGQFPININNPENVELGFQSKLAVMNSELFKKEEGDFLEFIRTLAMNVGDIFKEERIAKNMNISRRKVRKYTEILLKYNFIKAVGPWVENTDTELSRHVKVYFTDLSYFYAALGVSYYHGEGKQGVIENFVLGELDRKLKSTHNIHFYRKKSGAEVSFILVDKVTNKLTPIEITTRASDIIPQALKSFYESYSDRIDHAMILNDSIATRKDIGGNPIIILPHIAI